MKRSIVSGLLVLIWLSGVWVFSASAQNGAEPPYYGIFREVPPADVTPEGWLAEFLGRQRDGLGRNHAVCGFPLNTVLWDGRPPKAGWGNYAETAYLVDGLYRLGILLKDKPFIELGARNVKWTVEHPDSTGQLGPTPEFFKQEKYDWCYSFIFFTRAMMANYEMTGDKAILDAMGRHYLALKPDHGTSGRCVDDVEGMCWLYGKTGDIRYLQIAERTWSNWTRKELPRVMFSLKNLAASGLLKGHGVSVCEYTKQPALLYLYTGRKDYLDAGIGGFKSVERDHGLVDGVITSDEGLHGNAPEGLHETCVITDLSWSLGYLLMAGGDAVYGDKIERIIFNAGFGAVGKDFKSHQYFSSPNQVLATHTSSHSMDEKRQAYRPTHEPDCCTANIHRMIPNFALRQWLTDGKGGIAAAMYAPSTLRTKAGAERTEVTIAQKTGYPFSGTVELKISADKAVQFPLYLRIPGWAEGAAVSVNGKPVAEKPVPGNFLKLERKFKSGDLVKLEFPMRVRQETPATNGISLLRGPLVYSLKIPENRSKVTDSRAKNPDFPAWDIKPAGPWNYALTDLARVEVATKPVTDFPWTPDSAPVILTVPARRVQGWDVTPDGKNPPLPAAPLTLSEETEQVQLIPLGATYIRLSVFPSAGK